LASREKPFTAQSEQETPEGRGEKHLTAKKAKKSHQGREEKAGAQKLLKGSRSRSADEMHRSFASFGSRLTALRMTTGEEQIATILQFADHRLSTPMHLSRIVFCRAFSWGCGCDES
jgi:hypothetical protein